MNSSMFEEAFSDFLDSREYDQVESSIFAIIRAAFAAGWKAAEGEASQTPKIVQIVRTDGNGNFQKEELDSPAPEKQP